MPANIKDLKPKVKRMMDTLIVECKKSGFPIFITQGVRTMEEQATIYSIGRRGKVGEKVVSMAKPGYSPHNWGVAFDIAFVKQPIYVGPWGKVGALGESLGLEWGGRWASFPDRPHFQYLAGYKINYKKNDFLDKTVDWSKFV